MFDRFHVDACRSPSVNCNDGDNNDGDQNAIVSNERSRGQRRRRRGNSAPLAGNSSMYRRTKRSLISRPLLLPIPPPLLGRCCHCHYIEYVRLPFAVCICICRRRSTVAEPHRVVRRPLLLGAPLPLRCRCVAVAKRSSFRSLPPTAFASSIRSLPMPPLSLFCRRTR